MSRFDLVFTGELIGGCEPSRVRRDLERLFRTDAASIARLFTGEPVVIKKDLDEQTALRYRAALQQVGALCRIRPAAGAARAVAPGQQTPASSGLAGAAILPPGSILTEVRRVETPQFDLSAFSIAPPGETLVEHEAPAARPPAPGAFDVAPVGADLVEAPRIDPAPIPDISALTMSPPGTEVLRPEERTCPHPPLPDPGDLKLSDD
jgi:hypothetical protein